MRRIVRTFGLLLLPPALFVPVGIAFSVARQTPPDATSVPWILAITEVLLAGLALLWLSRWRYRAVDIGATGYRPRLLLFGIVTGIALALSYEAAVSPALDWLRGNIGDFVPPAETRRALGSARVPFVIANVLFAPFVEELIYRGLLERRLSELWSTRASFFWGALGFGLLHWAGGVFYILATGLLGASLLWLRRRTGSLWTSTAAHFAFNTLEVVLSFAR